MGLFSKVKAAVGVGASQVQVVLEDGRYHWGDTIKGKVIVQGGSVEQNASEISVNVTETWYESDSDGDRERRTRAYNQRTIASQVPIPVESSQEWEFEVKVPDDASLGSEWSVAARVSVPGAVDRHGKADFALLAPRGVLALANLVCQLAECEMKSCSNASTKITVGLKPLPQRKKDLDGLTLIVTDDGRQVTGTLEINPQEKSLADRFKALAKKDRVRHSIAFDTAALTGPGGADGVSESVVGQLRGFIAPHLS